MRAAGTYYVYILASGRHGTLYIGVTSDRRQQLVSAIIREKLSAALPLDRGTARGRGRGVGGDAERAAQAVDALFRFAGGEGGA